MILAGRYQVRRRLAGDAEAELYLVVDDGPPRPELRVLLARRAGGPEDLRAVGAASGLAGLCGLVDRFEHDHCELLALDLAGGQSLAEGLPQHHDAGVARLLLSLLQLLSDLAEAGADLDQVTVQRLLWAGAALRFAGPLLPAPEDGASEPLEALTRLRGALLADDGCWSAELLELLTLWRAGAWRTPEALGAALEALVEPALLTDASGLVSHEGLVRRANEDAVLRLNEDILAGEEPLRWWLLAVADGMGGHRGGRQAAELALHSLAYALVLQGAAAVMEDRPGLWRDNEEITTLLKWAVGEAHRAVATLAEAGEERAPGCTLTAVLHLDRRLFVMHVGDSRAYLWRGHRLTRLTRDDTLVQQMVDEGGLAPGQVQGHPAGHVLTQCLGQAGEITPGLSLRLAMPGDRLLLCSDGITECLSDDDLAQLLAADESPAANAERIVLAALQAGSRDNVTAVVEDLTRAARG
jgi:protein phosphatase